MKKLRYGVEFIAASVLLVGCCGGRLYGVFPFGAPMFLALVMFALPAAFDKKTAVGGAFFAASAAVYLLCPFLFTFELWRLYISGAVVVIAAVQWFLSLKFPRMGKPLPRVVFAVAAIVMDAVLLGVFTSVAVAAVSGFVSTVFLYFAKNAATIAINKFAFRPSVPDAAALCFVLAVFGLTFGRIRLDGMFIGMAFMYFVMLMLCVTGVKPLLAGGLAMALGLGFSDVTAAVCAIAAVGVLAVFLTLPRPIYALIGVFALSAFGVLFGVSASTIGYNAAFAAAGALPFLLIPKRAVQSLKQYTDFDGSARLAVRHYINRVKADAGNRLLVLGSVFDETARLMTALGEPPRDATAASTVMRDRICPYCKKYGTCDGMKAADAFIAVAQRAESGRSALTDLPEFFTTECDKTDEVLRAAAALTDAAKERKTREESETKAREIVTERMLGIKDVLTELGSAQAKPVGFDGDAEKRLASELAARGIECAEAFVTDSGITAIVRTSAADRKTLCRAANACLKREYEVRSLEKTQASGWSVAALKRRPAYEAVYARAGVSKTGGVSGDSYTFERIGDKFLVALLDGMGTGDGAGQSSAAAVELVECFYKAGFDSRSALSGVNRFMKLPSGERFSAADVAVCDLDTADVDIIKIGAPPCYIKTADTVLKIDGSSLPIGVLDEMRPSVTSKRLYPGQMLVCVTDGVSDCFDGDELPEYINGLGEHNPERMANEILRRALMLSGETPKDDMTVVAFRLFENKRTKNADCA